MTALEIDELEAAEAAFLNSLPDVVPDEPDWLLEVPVSLEVPTCWCCGQPDHHLFDREDADPVPSGPAAEDFWAVPGVTGLDAQPEKVTPSVGQLLARLAELTDQLAAVTPAQLPAGQALGEVAALAGVLHQLRLAQVARITDVKTRELHQHLGYRAFSSWQGDTLPDTPTSDRTLAGRLETMPHLSAALHRQDLTFTRAGMLSKALGKLRPHLDRPDGLIDGQPAQPTLAAVGEHLIELICADRSGLDHDEDVDAVQAGYLADLETSVSRVLTGGTSQRDQLEQLLTLAGTRLRNHTSLRRALEDITYQLLPSVLEDRERCAHDKRALALTANSDGTWHLEGTLTAEVGEQIHAALAAEARRDPANPLDTHARAEARAAAAEAQARAEGRDEREVGSAGLAAELDLPEWEARALRRYPDGGLDPDQALVPRSHSKRLHDALGRLLTRYLEHGLGGTRSKIPVQASVTLSHRTVEGAPGAPPPRGGTGRPLARSVVRSWWGNSHVTALLMSRGWKPLGIVHTGRTLTATEWNATLIQYGHRCPGIGCCSGEPHPLIPLVPHHVHKFAQHGRTSVGETVPACPVLHDDIHLGKKTIRLRDGRLISEDGILHDRQCGSGNAVS